MKMNKKRCTFTFPLLFEHFEVEKLCQFFVIYGYFWGRFRYLKSYFDFSKYESHSTHLLHLQIIQVKKIVVVSECNSQFQITVFNAHKEIVITVWCLVLKCIGMTRSTDRLKQDSSLRRSIQHTSGMIPHPL